MQRGQQTGIARASEPGDVDPIEAAKRDVGRSKDLAASAAEELRQHHRWLQDALATEAQNREKHASSLKRQQVIQQRLLKRQRLILVVRRILLFLLKGAFSALIYLCDLLLIGCTWFALSIRAVALSLLRLLSISASWSGQKARVLALSLGQLLSIGFSRSRVRAHTLALGSLRVASSSASWVRATTRRIALSGFKQIAAAQILSRHHFRVGVTDLVRKFSEQARIGVGDLKRSALTTNRLLLTLISREGGRLSRASGMRSPVGPRPQEGTDLKPESEARIESKVDHEEPAPKKGERKKMPERVGAIPAWAWIVGAVLVIVIISTGYRVVQMQHLLQTVRSELVSAKDEAAQTNAQVVEFEKRADRLKSVLEKANAQRNELQTKLDQATTEMELAKSRPCSAPVKRR
jgi:hypothetical protein